MLKQDKVVKKAWLRPPSPPSWPKSKCTVTKLNKSMKIDKYMSKILTKLLSLVPLSNKKGVNVDPINPELFEF